jgi:hypothetical protein
MPVLNPAVGLPSNMLKMVEKNSIAHPGRKKNAPGFALTKYKYVINF